MSSDPQDDPYARWLWRIAQGFAVWSGAGFALAHTVDPQFVNMGIGIGIFVPVFVGLAIAEERAEARDARRRSAG